MKRLVKKAKTDYFYHGTRMDYLLQILESGYLTGGRNTNGGNAYGDGTYLSPDFTWAESYAYQCSTNQTDPNKFGVVLEFSVSPTDKNVYIDEESAATWLLEEQETLVDLIHDGLISSVDDNDDGDGIVANNSDNWNKITYELRDYPYVLEQISKQAIKGLNYHCNIVYRGQLPAEDIISINIMALHEDGNYKWEEINNPSLEKVKSWIANFKSNK